MLIILHSITFILCPSPIPRSRLAYWPVNWPLRISYQEVPIRTPSTWGYCLDTPMSQTMSNSAHRQFKEPPTLVAQLLALLQNSANAAFNPH